VSSAGFSFHAQLIAKRSGWMRHRLRRELTFVCDSQVLGEYLVIRALENGVQVIGLTRGAETRFHHAEKLDKDELMIFQFTEYTSAMKIRGKVQLFTKHGVINTADPVAPSDFKQA
jgi:transcription attenuation protein (tryptophan RNA-binding attenuator protein)